MVEPKVLVFVPTGTLSASPVSITLCETKISRDPTDLSPGSWVHVA